MRISRKPVAVVAAAVLSLTAGGVGWAAWSSNGTGNGSAKALSAQPISVVAVTPSSGDLYPGGPAGAIQLSLSNPNPYPVSLTSVAYGAVTSSDTSACPSSNVTVAGGAPAAVNFALPANSSGITETIAGVLAMAHSAVDGCQGKSFTVGVTLSGAQN